VGELTGRSVSGSTGFARGDVENWTPLRVVVVGLCFALNMLDGADMLIMSFIAPVLSVQWRVSPESLGVIFSASLVGMAIGCLFVAPLADRFGRRPMILGALLLVTVSMVMSGYVHTVGEMLVARLFVGIGVGTIGVSMSAMAAEFAPQGRASFAVGFVQAGWPLGSIITAFVAASIIADHGWQSLLVGIGLTSLFLLTIAASSLPESISFLAGRRPANALERINKIVLKLGMATISELGPAPDKPKRIAVFRLFAGNRLRASILLWTAVTFGYFVLYFAISWIPKLSVDAGLKLEDAIYAGATYNFGAFIGTTLVGWLGSRYRLNRVIALFFGLSVVALLVFGSASMPVLVTLFVAMGVGITVQGAFNGFWPLAAKLYPTEMRGTGIGWALGVGRIGAVLGPVVGGILVGAGFSIAAIFAVFAVPPVIAAALCLLIRDADIIDV
jgi:benzoate transport